MSVNDDPFYTMNPFNEWQRYVSYFLRRKTIFGGNLYPMLIDIIVDSHMLSAHHRNPLRDKTLLAVACDL